MPPPQPARRPSARSAAIRPVGSLTRAPLLSASPRTRQLRRRQVEREGGEAFVRGDRDPPPHALRQLACDRQAEPRAIAGFRRVEALEDPPLDALRDARPFIGDGQLDAAVDGVGGHGHLGALGGVREGIVEQDTGDLTHPLRVGAGDHRAARAAQLEPRAVLVGARPELERDVAGEGVEVDGVGLDDDRPGVELGEVEQVGGELGQPLDLLAHRVHELGPLLGARVLVLEQLDEAAEAEDRRAQLVRGVGDELFAGSVELGQAALHFVEGAGELAELARGVDRDAAAEVAVGDLAGRVLEPRDPPPDDLGAVVADHEGDQQREKPADDDPVLGARLALDDDDPDVDDDRARHCDRQGGPGHPSAERRAEVRHYSLKR